jgi:hygromycin-B 7''-O-kinase
MAFTSDTKEYPDDPEQIDEVISAHLDTDYRIVKSINQGSVSSIFRVEFGPHKSPLILKQYPPNARWRMKKELRVYLALSELKNVPSPDIIKSSLDAEDPGIDFLLMSELTGSPLGQQKLEVDESEDIFRQIGQVLKAIHSYTFDTFGRLDDGYSGEFSTNKEFLKSNIDNAIGELSTYDSGSALVRRIEAFLCGGLSSFPWPRQASLCHGDYNETNILIMKEDSGWSVSGVIDVENAFAGDPAYDIAIAELSIFANDDVKKQAFLDGYDMNPTAIEDRIRFYKVLHTLRRHNWLISKGEQKDANELASTVDGLIA